MQEGEYSDHQAVTKSPWVGTVMAVQANFYQVRLMSDPHHLGTDVSARFLLCTRRSRLKKMGQTVMVGDQVVIAEPDWASGRGAIVEVLPRQTQLDRPAMANADQILLIFAIAEPNLDFHQLSRFLVKAESTGLGVKLCLNKCDLVAPDQAQQTAEICQQWGYTPLLISLSSETGLNPLHAQLQDKITVVAGPSGVGKSSLINQLIPTAQLRVGAVSGKLGRGRHTTRHVELFQLPSGGLLADTPGFNHPQLECSPEALIHYFPEARQRLSQGSCQFHNCAHRDEPNCIVRGEWQRYSHYLEFLEEVITRGDILHQQGEVELGTKSKTKGGGKRQDEPKLEAKKYRRVSRRVQHQSLEELCRDVELSKLQEDEEI